MKKIIFFVFSLTFFVFVVQAGNPPDAVSSAFKTKFPQADHIKWMMEDSTQWEAEFDLNGIELSANYTPDGSWVETETEIKTTALPQAVTDAIKKDNPGCTILEAAKTETSKNETIYEAEIKTGKEKKEVAYHADGTVVTN